MESKQAPLGNLELAVMKVLWDAKQALEVKEVVDRLGEARAYTTVMTTLSRLHKKGYLHQKKEGRSFLYRPRISRDTVLRRIITPVADFLFNGDIRQIVPHLLGIERELNAQERERLREISEDIKDEDDE